MPSLTFPDLETKQIVMLMKELGVNLEEKNLLNPTSEIMWPLYETVAQNLLGISRYGLCCCVATTLPTVKILPNISLESSPIGRFVSMSHNSNKLKNYTFSRFFFQISAEKNSSNPPSTFCASWSIQNCMRNQFVLLPHGGSLGSSCLLLV